MVEKGPRVIRPALLRHDENRRNEYDSPLDNNSYLFNVSIYSIHVYVIQRSQTYYPGSRQLMLDHVVSKVLVGEVWEMLSLTYRVDATSYITFSTVSKTY